MDEPQESLFLVQLRQEPSGNNIKYFDRVHSPIYVLFHFKKHIKIYIKLHINIVPTCFGLRPSSGSLH